MTENTDRLLTIGLGEGYAGKNEVEKITRAGFNGKSTDLQRGDDHYHDEWFANDNGGGQELVTSDGESATRVYAGGVIPQNELEELGLTTKDVISKLLFSVGELKEKTRLHTPCSLEIDGDWRYEYKILNQPKEVDLTIGYESISFKGREVFVHGHIISPVK